MVFNSIAFLIFFPIVLLLYRVIPVKYRWIMLLAASYYFYCSWQADLLYLILFTTVVSYLCSHGIAKTNDPKKKKLYLIIALVASLSVLFFFKYFNFLSENVVNLLKLFALPVSDFSLKLILPVGISFYTFQTLSYVIDVYRGNIEAEKHFGYYALYVSYFPQLVAGPIERPENLIPQLKTDNKFNVADSTVGLKMMMVGFFKKIVIADQLSKYVNAVYNNLGTDADCANGFTVVLATVLFAVQIYCDFSGYTDIAIGCARCMGIKLMQNFNDPYSATNIKTFWRRWHISLTSWFTDYVYIPLGGSRCSKARHYLNIMIVFLLSGIWHGAAWTFILWGVVHGLYQIIGDITSKPRSAMWKKLNVDEKGPFVTWLRRILTFCLVCFAWIMFRANSISDLGKLISTLFTGWGGLSISASLDSMGLSLTGIIITILSIILLKILDEQIETKAVPTEAGKGLSVERANAYVFVCWAIAIAWLILLRNNEASSFIYFQF
ncbi:MAG: MBOAT family protein [Firmicutes bacterium]|nr:MBOAT family protein [Candidatus Colimorpha enterica]